MTPAAPDVPISSPGANATHEDAPPLLSLVTICRNAVDDLVRTYESIRNLNDRDVEWVVVDGASRDGTRQFLESCSFPRLSWASEPDKGIYDAMNKGVHASKGMYTLFLNAGDELVVDHWSTVKNIVADGVESADIFYFDALYDFNNGVRRLRPARDGVNYIEHGMPANHQATVIRSQSLARQPFDLRYKLCGDYANLAALHSAGARSRVVHLPLAVFHAGGASTTQLRALFLEPAAVQREILALSWLKVGRSFAIRLASTLGFRLHFGLSSLLGRLERDK